MQDSDWLLLYEAEKSFGFKINREGGKLLEVYEKLLRGEVQFYDSNALPVVFEGKDEGELKTVEEAIEDSDGFYQVEEDDDEGYQEGMDVSYEF